jgi:hypothetical protein
LIYHYDIGNRLTTRSRGCCPRNGGKSFRQAEMCPWTRRSHACLWPQWPQSTANRSMIVGGCVIVTSHSRVSRNRLFGQDPSSENAQSGPNASINGLKVMVSIDQFQICSAGFAMETSPDRTSNRPARTRLPTSASPAQKKAYEEKQKETWRKLNNEINAAGDFYCT